MTPVRLKPAASGSRVKHSTTDPTLNRYMKSSDNFTQHNDMLLRPIYSMENGSFHKLQNPRMCFIECVHVLMERAANLMLFGLV